MFKMLIVLLGVISAYLGVTLRPEMNQAQSGLWFILVLAIVIIVCLQFHKFIEKQISKLHP